MTFRDFIQKEYDKLSSCYSPEEVKMRLADMFRGTTGEFLVCQFFNIIKSEKRNNPDFDAITKSGLKIEIKIICDALSATISNFIKNCDYVLIVIFPGIIKGLDDYSFCLIHKSELSQIDDGYSSRNGKNIGKWVLPTNMKEKFKKNGEKRKQGHKQIFLESHLKTSQEILEIFEKV